MSHYHHQGTRVLLVFDANDSRHAADCDDAAKACDLLNRARYANDVRRQYTKAARLIAQAESIPSFTWTQE